MNLPKAVTAIAIFITAIYVPYKIIDKHLDHPDKNWSFVLFGTKFIHGPLGVAIPEVQALQLKAAKEDGYDGQRYAQLATDPFLTDPETLSKALPDPAYRARRIGLPLTAYLFALGNKERALWVYSISNIAFYYLFLGLFIFWKRPKTLKDNLLMCALFLTSGTLISVDRALTDFAAAAFAVVGCVISQNRPKAGASLLSLACLYKETTVLSLFALTPMNALSEWRKSIQKIAIAVGPVFAWALYTKFVFRSELAGNGNFAIPFTEVIQKVSTAIHNWGSSPGWSDQFELLSVLSLIAQSTYLLLHRRWDSIYWRLGIGFVILFFLLSNKVLVEQNAFMRVLLPITFSFNLTLHAEEKSNYRYWTYFILGNVGCLWALNTIFW